ncbi:hypothetical protein [Chroococcidiopsis sp. CCALA 051]|nr:hypothetical protein [Chroococcidiopsis sp. CCALA 051]
MTRIFVISLYLRISCQSQLSVLSYQLSVISEQGVGCRVWGIGSW